MRPVAMMLALAALFGTSPALGGDDERGKTGQSGKSDDEERAETRYSAQVLVLHATNDGKGIDPRIGKLPQLKKPPFSSYDTYKLLDRAKLPLEKNEPKKLKLPNQRLLKTKLLAELPEDTARLSASINKPGGKTYLPLLEVKAKVGQAFIVAGQSYKKGILVLVIRVVE